MVSVLRRRGRRGLDSPLMIVAPNRARLIDRCRALAHPVYLGDDVVLCRILGLLSFYLDRRDASFAGRVLLDGFWEIEATLFISRRVRPGMTAIDIGANYGYYTLLLGALVGETGHVIAIEPNPDAAALLRRSLMANDLSGRTTLHEVAAGASDGNEVSLAVPECRPMNARIVYAPAEAGNDRVAHRRVRQVTVDALAAGLPRIDFVKIDAEGAEERVIEGMLTTLQRHRPSLVLEFNIERVKEPTRLLRLLSELYGGIGYIDDDGDRAETTLAQLTSQRRGCDWMLCFDPPGRPNS